MKTSQEGEECSGPRILWILTPVFRLWIRTPLAKSGEQDPIWIGEQIDLLRRVDPIQIEVWAIQWQPDPFQRSHFALEDAVANWARCSQFSFRIAVSIDVGAKIV